MISPIDYAIVAVYLLFVVAIGVVFRRSSKNTSDYFRAGGAMPWWITGTSAWIAGFSAWTFTGAAGKVYETGSLVLVLYYGNLVGLFLVYAFMCTRFRRMRVVTWMEGVRQRFGPFTEGIYTWIKVPFLLLFSGVGLNAIGVFISSMTHVDLTTTLVVLGVVITLVAFAGGAWAILASDFVQMMLVMTITIITAILTLCLPQIGGISGLISKLPPAHFHWTDLARPETILLWGIAIVMQGALTATNMESSPMYLMSKSDRDARRMVLIPIIGSLIGPLIWFIPSMAATVLHPNLAAEYPALKAPHEAAFVSIALQVMPTGLIGLLMSAMLGATLTNMDAGVNKGVGVFVRSFYLPVVNPNASEKTLLRVSKGSTLVFGMIIVLIAVEFSRIRTMGLFDLVNQLSASLLAPLALPLALGLVYKRTPSWSAWSTALVGFLVSSAINGFVRPEMIQHILGYSTPLSKREATDLMLAATVICTFSVAIAWFFFTSLFYAKDSVANRNRNESFFTNLVTPMVEAKDENRQDIMIYRLLGKLCLVYGTFVVLLMAIPNSLVGRSCFLFCGGVILLAGFAMSSLARRHAATVASVGAVEVVQEPETVGKVNR